MFHTDFRQHEQLRALELENAELKAKLAEFHNGSYATPAREAAADKAWIAMREREHLRMQSELAQLRAELQGAWHVIEQLMSPPKPVRLDQAVLDQVIDDWAAKPGVLDIEDLGKLGANAIGHAERELRRQMGSVFTRSRG